MESPSQSEQAVVLHGERYQVSNLFLLWESVWKSKSNFSIKRDCVFNLSFSLSTHHKFPVCIIYEYKNSRSPEKKYKKKKIKKKNK